MTDNQVKFTKSQREADKAVHQGSMYTRHKRLVRGVKWRCDLRDDCNGGVVLNDQDIVVEKGAHTHVADWGRCKARECVVDLNGKLNGPAAPPLPQL